MTRLDGLARRLAERPSPAGTPERDRAAPTDPALDRIARVLAAPMSRRRVLRLGAAAAGASFFAQPSRALAQAADDPCPTCADRPGTMPCCVRLSDTLARVAVGQCYYPATEHCCTGPSSYDGLPTAWICPNSKTCGADGVELCICKQQCEDLCCDDTEVCELQDPQEGQYTCYPRCADDSDIRCITPLGDSTHCCSDQEDCCGSGCCDDDHVCCGDDASGWCCPIDQYDNCGGFGECRCIGAQQCGNDCCPSGQICFSAKDGDCRGPRLDELNNWLDHLFRVSSNAGAASGASAAAAGHRSEGMAAASGSTDALIAVSAVASLAALARDRLRSPRPDRAYRRPVRVPKPKLRALEPGPGLDQAAAHALDRQLVAEARAWALVNAAAVARERALGAIRGHDLRAARTQALAFAQFARRAAKVLRGVPALRRASSAALQAGGAQEVIVSPAQVTLFQHSVRTGGLPSEMRARLAQLGIGRADRRRVAKVIVRMNLRRGPVLISPLTEPAQLAAIAKLARTLSRTGARTRRRPLVSVKPGPGKVRGSRPHASRSTRARDGH